MIDFRTRYRSVLTRDSPWGGTGSRALITTAETALERQISATIMGGKEVDILRVAEAGPWSTRATRGGPLRGAGRHASGGGGRRGGGRGSPGPIVGERAILEGGRRTATLRALTPVKAARATKTTIAPALLAEVGTQHRREKV